ncbi:GH14138 [Drosophila grimshawi]|uniref:GH14138 n=1 Tax=Drosophila grimshawi TaxID=7222 RepID=B4JXW4_DROGR|nr:GH14138 [Drosophila grimshawi]
MSKGAREKQLHAICASWRLTDDDVGDESDGDGDGDDADVDLLLGSESVKNAFDIDSQRRRSSDAAQQL